MYKIIAFSIFYFRIVASLPYDSNNSENDQNNETSLNQQDSSLDLAQITELTKTLQNLQPQSLPIPNYVEKIFDEKRQQHIPILFQHGDQIVAHHVPVSDNQYATHYTNIMNGYSYQQVPQIHYQNYAPIPQHQIQLPQYTQHVIYQEHPPPVTYSQGPAVLHPQHYQNMVPSPNVIHVPLAHPAQSAPIHTYNNPISGGAYSPVLSSYPIYHINSGPLIPGISRIVTDAIAVANSAINTASAASAAATSAGINALAAAHQLAVAIAHAVSVASYSSPSVSHNSSDSSSPDSASNTPPISNPTVAAAFKALNNALQDAKNKTETAQAVFVTASESLINVYRLVKHLSNTSPSDLANSLLVTGPDEAAPDTVADVSNGSAPDAISAPDDSCLTGISPPYVAPAATDSQSSSASSSADSAAQTDNDYLTSPDAAPDAVPDCDGTIDSDNIEDSLLTQVDDSMEKSIESLFSEDFEYSEVK